MYIYIYTVYVCFIYEYVWWFVEIFVCVCLAMLLGFSKWSKPNVSTRMFVKSGMFVLFWKLSKPSNATWHHRWICLGLLWKNHTEKRYEKTSLKLSIPYWLVPDKILVMASYNPFISGSSCTTKNHIFDHCSFEELWMINGEKRFHCHEAGISRLCSSNLMLSRTGSLLLALSSILYFLFICGSFYYFLLIYFDLWEVFTGCFSSKNLLVGCHFKKTSTLNS